MATEGAKRFRSLGIHHSRLRYFMHTTQYLGGLRTGTPSFFVLQEAHHDCAKRMTGMHM